MPTSLDTLWTGGTFSPPVPLDIATIENAIVAQLLSQINQIEVVHFPDRPEAYRLTHQVGAALVSYRGATYGDLIDTDVVMQERKLEFEVRLMARDLGWSYGALATGVSPGAYALLEAVRAALTGFRIPGCRETYPLKERFVERDPQGGVWIYAISFAVETLAVQAAPADQFPLFIQGLAQDADDEIVAAVGWFQETFDVNGLVQLPYGNLSDVTVTDQSGRLYLDQTDYTVDIANGSISIVAGGALAPGVSVNIACGYDPSVVIT
ncbi:MAG TPA: Gp37 family protein [Candidatus Binataceae bacterium]|nr:Gp37 family protein [Candidatus Binataceae bacterium]